MSFYDSTVDLVQCKFSGNSATKGGDIYNNGGTVNIDGCPAGFSGAGVALNTYNKAGAINGEAKGYDSCSVCVR